MKLSIPVVKTIQKRHSVRTYESKPLLPQDREALLMCMKQLDNPFGVPVHTYIIDQKLNADGEKLGTYGVIKGASTFLGISIPDIKLAPLAAGYEFENLILSATHMGLGTGVVGSDLQSGQLCFGHENSKGRTVSGDFTGRLSRSQTQPDGKPDALHHEIFFPKRVERAILSGGFSHSAYQGHGRSLCPAAGNGAAGSLGKKCPAVAGA